MATYTTREGDITQRVIMSCMLFSRHPLTIAAIADAMAAYGRGRTQAGISYHLRKLERAGMVKRHMKSRRDTDTFELTRTAVNECKEWAINPEQVRGE